MKKYTLIVGTVLTLLAILLFAVFSGSGQAQDFPEVTQTQFLRPPQNLHDARYCEIVPAHRSGLSLTLKIHVTMSLNNCPDALWQPIDVDALAEEYGAYSIKKNGPRFWTMNEMTARGSTLEGPVVDFNGIQMRQVAVLETSLLDVYGRSDAFFENEVQRSTTFTYYAGTMVYELISPTGDVYRMQSYAQIVDPTLTMADLETLGERLELPEGWRFDARVLTEESSLNADGLAFVIQDEFENSYQKMTP